LTGSRGDKGDPGEAGKNGVSAKAISFSGAKGTCTEGGIEVESAGSPTFVCNGVKGVTGFTETLPKGKTETGVWAAAIPSIPSAPTTAGSGTSAVSFNIPLSSAPQFVYVPPGEEEEFEVECPGSPFAPAAAEGFACFYAFSESNISQSGQFALPQGVLITFNTPEGVEEPGGEAAGTWAVTAP
jgi:hypothetical protein